jgi:Ca2+-binding RTX toxin-like protein
MNRTPSARTATVLLSSLALTGTLVTPAAPASAAASCFDYIDFTSRVSTVVGTAGINEFDIAQNAVVSALAGGDRVRTLNGVAKVTVCLDAGDDSFAQGLNTASVTSLFSVSGGDGNDVVTGGNGPDQFRTDVGNDVSDGRGGDDYVFGGAGNDTLFGGPGNDTVRGDDGDDTIFGDAGNDILLGGAGVDTIDGGAGIDTCNGAETYVNCEVF